MLLGEAFPRVRIPVRTAARRYFCEKERGLLKGISDVANADDYSRTINLKDAADLLRDTKYLYNVVTKESKTNLTEIIEKAEAFMMNQTEIWDRDDLQDALKVVFAQCSQLVCLLGGKSTGKSLVLRNLERLNKGTVFRVNLREGSDILKALLKVLEERRNYYLYLESENTMNIAGKIASVAAEMTGKGVEYRRVLTVFDALLNNNNATKSLEGLIKELVKSREDKITLIIDEANIAFIIKPETKEEKIESVRDALALFTVLTKETRKV